MKTIFAIVLISTPFLFPAGVAEQEGQKQERGFFMDEPFSAMEVRQKVYRITQRSADRRRIASAILNIHEVHVACNSNVECQERAGAVVAIYNKKMEVYAVGASKPVSMSRALRSTLPVQGSQSPVLLMTVVKIAVLENWKESPDSVRFKKSQPAKDRVVDI